MRRIIATRASPAAPDWCARAYGDSLPHGHLSRYTDPGHVPVFAGGRVFFAFAIVAMPGMRNLGDREFIRAFQVMDRVIQNKQPVFMLIWVGSVLAVVAAAVLGIARLQGVERLLMISAALAYLLGVQLPTVTINIPLNNKLQAVDVAAADAKGHHAAREGFERRWNRWNSIRAAFATLASALWVLLLFRL